MRAGDHGARRAGSVRWLGAAALVAFAVTACGNDGGVPPARHLPYRAVSAHAFGAFPTFADLDGDGRDEVLHVFEPSGRRPGNRMSVMIRTHELAEVDQLNYVGFVNPPHVLDLDVDGRKEIFVPVVRNDTLHLSVADAAGNKLFGFPLTTGRPRVEPEGELPWDPGILGFHLLDVNGDGARELVTVLATGYARDPRGVFVHSLPEGELLDSLLLGAGLWEEDLLERPGDPPVLILSSIGSDNGAAAGGFDDRHAYALAVDLAPSLRIRWSRTLGGIGDRVWARPGDLDRDGRPDLLIVTRGETGSEVTLVDPLTGAPFLSRDFPRLSYPVVTDIDGDGDSEIVAIEEESALVAISSGLAKERSVTLPTPVSFLQRWPDLDRDGRGELTVFASGLRTHLILDQDFEIAARIAASRGFNRQLYRRGAGRTPVLVTKVGDVHQGYELVRNRWYLVRRYGLPAAATVGPLLVLLILGAGIRARRRARLHEAVARAHLAGESSACLVLDRKGRIPWTAGDLAPLFRADGRSQDSPASLAQLDEAAPILAEFCRGLLDSDILEPVRTRLDGWGNGSTEPVHAVARPASLGTRGDPHWIVRCRSGPDGLDAEESATWTLMARRVAHDVKNPLSGILLTLDRMRDAVRDQAPEADDAMRPYANRIEERIEQLRRLSSNFLKFVDESEADRRRLDLSDVVRRSMITASQTIPDDITIRLRLAADPIPVVIDRGQFHSVVENLVANAVNAMPDGGTLVVRTGVARSLLLSPKQVPRDYGVLEIRDTGSGIPGAVRSRLFEPGFSTSKHGSGLGLSIVKKIVEDHGGQISLESELDVGSAFTVHLPLAEEDSSSATK